MEKKLILILIFLALVSARAEAADVYFYTSPNLCGSIYFWEQTFTDKSICFGCPEGGYEIRAYPCLNHAFSKWEPSGNVRIDDVYSQVTRAFVHGDGKIKAIFSPERQAVPIGFTKVTLMITLVTIALILILIAMALRIWR